MSLIQKALEKAARETENKEQASTGASAQEAISLDTFLEKPTAKFPTAENDLNKRKPRRSRAPWILTALAVMILMLAGSWYFFQNDADLNPLDEDVRGEASVLSGGLGLPKATAVQQKKADQPSRLSQNQSNSQTVSGAEYILTGVTNFGTDHFAIINNEIVKLGGVVREGVVLKEIKADAVVLDASGREIFISLR